MKYTAHGCEIELSDSEVSISQTERRGKKVDIPFSEISRLTHLPADGSSFIATAKKTYKVSYWRDNSESITELFSRLSAACPEVLSVTSEGNGVSTSTGAPNQVEPKRWSVDGYEVEIDDAEVSIVEADWSNQFGLGVLPHRIPLADITAVSLKSGKLLIGSARGTVTVRRGVKDRVQFEEIRDELTSRRPDAAGSEMPKAKSKTEREPVLGLSAAWPEGSWELKNFALEVTGDELLVTPKGPLEMGRMKGGGRRFPLSSLVAITINPVVHRIGFGFESGKLQFDSSAQEYPMLEEVFGALNTARPELRHQEMPPKSWADADDAGTAPQKSWPVSGVWEFKNLNIEIDSEQLIVTPISGGEKIIYGGRFRHFPLTNILAITFNPVTHCMKVGFEEGWIEFMVKKSESESLNEVYGALSTLRAELEVQAMPPKRWARPTDSYVMPATPGASPRVVEKWPNARYEGTFPNKKTIVAIEQHCGDGEAPWLILGSAGAGALVAWSDRIMIIKTGAFTGFMAGTLGGGRATTFFFPDITGLEFNGQMMSGVLEILTASYQGTANKDYWKGTMASRNADANDPYTLSNTLPLPKQQYNASAGSLNKLRSMIAASKGRGPATQAVTVHHPAQVAQSVADQLTKLAELRNAGALSDAEFAAAKAQLLR